MKLVCVHSDNDYLKVNELYEFVSINIKHNITNILIDGKHLGFYSWRFKPLSYIRKKKIKRILNEDKI
jgi:hypothetical protein